MNDGLVLSFIFLCFLMVCFLVCATWVLIRRVIELIRIKRKMTLEVVLEVGVLMPVIISSLLLCLSIILLWLRTGSIDSILINPLISALGYTASFLSLASGVMIVCYIITLCAKNIRSRK